MPDDDALVSVCLRKIVLSPVFRHSCRSKKFLEFVVERKLAGREGEIKERTIGVEVFGRPPDFDTSADAIVRVNASDLRKRLAQYYADLPNPDPVRISLPHGSYVPEFTVEPKTVVPESEAEAVRPSGAPAARPWRIGLALAVPAVLTLSYFAWQLSPPVPADPSPAQRFWAPMLQSRSVILSLPSTRTITPRPPFKGPLKPAQWASLKPDGLWFLNDWHTSLPVLQAALAVNGVLAKSGVESVVRIGEDVKADELRLSPIISIGSFSSPWAGRNTSEFRFRFERGASGAEAPSIIDKEDSGRRWTLTGLFPDGLQTKDYAIVTRTLPPVFAQPFVSLAGLHSFGNQVAGDFAVSESAWRAVAARAPAGWERMNLQVVLEADVVGTNVGPPKVLATHFWK